MNTALSLIVIWLLLNALYFWWMAFGRYRNGPYPRFREAHQLR